MAALLHQPPKKIIIKRLQPAARTNAEASFNILNLGTPLDTRLIGQIRIFEPVHGLDLWYFPDFLTAEEANSLHDHLLSSVPWFRVQYKSFGQLRTTPRYTTCFGCDDSGPNNSKYKKPVQAWPQVLQDLQTLARSSIPIQAPKANCILMNYYKESSDSITWHSDDERFLGSNPTILSFSLGGTRTFRIRHKQRLSPTRDFTLKQGSLLIMGGQTQHFWEHSVPKCSQIDKPRMNITMRHAINYAGTNNYYKYNRGDGEPVKLAP